MTNSSVDPGLDEYSRMGLPDKETWLGKCGGVIAPTCETCKRQRYKRATSPNVTCQKCGAQIDLSNPSAFLREFVDRGWAVWRYLPMVDERLQVLRQALATAKTVKEAQRLREDIGSYTGFYISDADRNYTLYRDAPDVALAWCNQRQHLLRQRMVDAESATVRTSLEDEVDEIKTLEK
jgi:hypothetical protein